MLWNLVLLIPILCIWLKKIMFFISYGRDAYVGDFSEKMKLADFGKFISEFILILRKKKQKKGVDGLLQESLYLKAHSELIPHIKACFEDYF